jgi:fucose permease
VTERNRIFAVLALGFVLLGVSVTIHGVAWPSVAESFNRPLSNLGFVTLLYGSGYTVSTLVSGRLAESPGIGPILLLATGSATVGLVSLASSPSFPVYLAGAGLLGLAGGFVDAGTNTYVAIRRGAREMGLIHGSVGIGAIAGPLLVTALLESGVDWRFAFGSLAVAQALYAIPLWKVSSRLDVPTRSVRYAESASLRSPVTFWSLAVFFAYAGMATSAGVWAFTYLTEERSFSEGLGGLIVAGYFAGFTASRLALGVVGERLDPNAVLRWSSVATVTALAVFWAGPGDWLAVVALIAAGFAHGPIFPLEMLLTPRRVGDEATPRLVGYEIAAANVGGAAVPGIVGIAVGRAGLDVIPPLLVVFAVLVAVTVERLRARSVPYVE